MVGLADPFRALAGDIEGPMVHNESVEILTNSRR